MEGFYRPLWRMWADTRHFCFLNCLWEILEKNYRRKHFCATRAAIQRCSRNVSGRFYAPYIHVRFLQTNPCMPLNPQRTDTWMKLGFAYQPQSYLLVVKFVQTHASANCIVNLCANRMSANIAYFMDNWKPVSIATKLSSVYDYDYQQDALLNIVVVVRKRKDYKILAFLCSPHIEGLRYAIW